MYPRRLAPDGQLSLRTAQRRLRFQAFLLWLAGTLYPHCSSTWTIAMQTCGTPSSRRCGRSPPRSRPSSQRRSTRCTADSEQRSPWTGCCKAAHTDAAALVREGGFRGTTACREGCFGIAIRHECPTVGLKAAYQAQSVTRHSSIAAPRGRAVARLASGLRSRMHTAPQQLCETYHPSRWSPPSKTPCEVASIGCGPWRR